jgi:hypothetical protein
MEGVIKSCFNRNRAVKGDLFLGHEAVQIQRRCDGQQDMFISLNFLGVRNW